MAILEADLAEMAKGGVKVFDGATAFKLHDTFGFPLDLTADVCRERGVTVDAVAFDKAMAHQKEQARAAGKFKMALNLDYSGPASAFKGYTELECRGSVLALYREGAPVDVLHEGDFGVVVLDATPFYAESGGQVGDRGALVSAQGIFSVEDTQKIQAAVFGHHGILKTGTLRVGETVAAKVDIPARLATMRNHSVTHLMHKALREVLGSHVQQKGSQVDADKTRFDFAHNQPMSAEEIRRVETLVNGEILTNAEASARVMPLEEAQKTGAMMLFGEKYGDEVRVIGIGSSIELCGGTHVTRSGDIGFFKIVGESGVAAGVRRVEAVSGGAALNYVQALAMELDEVAYELGFQSASGELMVQKVRSLQDQLRAERREKAQLVARFAAVQGDDLSAQAVDLKGCKVLAARLEGADAKALRELLDKLKDKLKSAAIVLGSVSEGKVTLIAGVTADLTGKVKAGELVNHVAMKVGGKGGGRADMAQAGGTQPEYLDEALASVPGWVEAKL
jgi:alanyl-tRNA synthetase